MAHTGRVVTAAALLMAITFASLMSADVSLMRIFGLGVPLAVLMDATLVRMLLVPAFMKVLGRANWWAPEPLVRLHRRIGISESPSPPKLPVPVGYPVGRVPAEAGLTAGGDLTRRPACRSTRARSTAGSPAATIHSSGLISRALPDAARSTTQAMNPTPMPLAIE